MAAADYTVENKGTLLLLRSSNAKAYDWLVAHTDPEAHWFGRALVVVAIALITMLVLFWMNSQPTAEETAAVQQQPTVIQQPAPAQQPPVIIQQPAAPATQPAPIIVTPPAGGSTAPSTTQSVNIDSTIQTAVDKRISDDPAFSSLGITASVLDGKVMLIGTVATAGIKADVERAVKQIKGVKAVDNQIIVSG